MAQSIMLLLYTSESCYNQQRIPEQDWKLYMIAIIDLHPCLIRMSRATTIAQSAPKRRKIAPSMVRLRGGT